jgi:hypothetical protein
MSLDGKVKPLGYPSYSAYLNSDHWHYVRARYLMSDRPQACVSCGKPHTLLHHLTYDNLGKERLNDLIPMCHRCHRNAHKAMKKYKITTERPDLALQKAYRWTDDERKEKFKFFQVAINTRTAKKKRTKDRRQQQIAKKVAFGKKTDAGRFYKVSNQLPLLQRCITDGYTVDQMALNLGVKKWYLLAFMKRFPEYFKK